MIRPRKSRVRIPLASMLTFLVAFFAFCGGARAQTTPGTNFDAAMTELVSRLTEPLKKVKAKKVLVFDLRGPSEQAHPAGKLLADRVSTLIGSQLPKVQTINRSQLGSNNEATKPSTGNDALFSEEIKQARSVGADTLVTGTFAKISDDQLGISLTIVGLAKLGETHDVRSGLVPISKDIANLTEEPIPGLELRDGIPLAGKGGIGMPICTHCQAPVFPNNQGPGGIVKLELVVTLAGRPDKIKIVTSPSPQLGEAAVRAVQDWRFEPARGFDGNPVAVVVPIQCSFHADQ